MLYLIPKLLHVTFALAMVAGLLGRTLAAAQARRAADIGMVAELYRLAGSFDRRLVIPGSQGVLILGILTAWVQGYPVFGFLQGATVNWPFASLLLFAVILVMVPTIFLPAGRVFAAELEKSVAADAVTPELKAAMHSRLVAVAHAAELAIVGVIVVLMVLKPF